MALLHPLFADVCTKQSILPDIYANLRTGSNCEVQFQNFGALTQLLANAIQILLVLGGFIAVGFIIFGAFGMMASQGEPQRIAKARDTMANAVIGLVITLLAFAVINVVSGRFT